MRAPKKTPRAEVSLSPAQGAQSEPQAWKPPTLTTWKIEEETLTKTGSTGDFGQY